MARKQVSGAPMVICAVLMLGAISAVALIGNFSQTGFGQSWPVLMIALGLSLLFFGYWELGLSLFGIFLIWLLANLALIPTFSKSWPFALIWIAVMVVIGFVRARNRVSNDAA